MAARRRMLANVGGLTLGSLAIGPYTAPTILKIKESGVDKDYIVIKHNYENSGRTLLLRKLIYPVVKAFGTNNAYSGSTADAWLNDGFLDLLDSGVHGSIAEVSIPYTIGNGNATVTTIDRKIFLLSGTEVGQSEVQYLNTEGSAIGFFTNDTSRIALLESGGTPANHWWSRSPHTYPDYKTLAYYVSPTGTYAAGGVSNTMGIRPAFTLPAKFKLVDNGDGTYSPK